MNSQGLHQSQSSKSSLCRISLLASDFLHDGDIRLGNLMRKKFHNLTTLSTLPVISPGNNLDGK